MERAAPLTGRLARLVSRLSGSGRPKREKHQSTNEAMYAAKHPQKGKATEKQVRRKGDDRRIRFPCDVPQKPTSALIHCSGKGLK